MIDAFLLKLILSFVIGSIWITTASILAERFGSKLGGVIAGTPSVQLFSLFFIGWTQSPEVASAATTIIPLLLGINAMVGLTFIRLSKINFSLAVFCAIGLWFLLSAIVFILQINSILISLVIFAVLLLFFIYMVEHHLTLPSQKISKPGYSKKEILSRALISGGIVATAVVAAKLGGPLLGGIFASFPTMAITLPLLHRRHGADFINSVMKSLVISGNIVHLVFSMGVRILVLSIGLVNGVVLSWILALVTAYFTYVFIRKRLS